MKRSSNGNGSNGKAKRDDSVISWLMKLKKPGALQEGVDIDAENDKYNINLWLVTLKANVFFNACPKYVLDDGTEVTDEDIIKGYRALDYAKETHTCYMLKKFMYKATLTPPSEYGGYHHISQENLVMGTRRNIRIESNAAQLYYDILYHYKLYKPGKSPEIRLEVTFPSRFPTEPPFIRVVEPRFQMHTGHVTVGGSICTELLTVSDSGNGWDSNFQPDIFIPTIASLFETNGRLDLNQYSAHPYSEKEAKDAFHRVTEHHRRVGWS